MKKIFLPLICLSTCIAAAAQNKLKDLSSYVTGSTPKPAADTIQKPWKIGGLINVNINQGSQSNWAAGGDNFSFAAAGLFNGTAFYTKGKNIWDNTLNASYGYINASSLGARVNADQYDLNSSYGYAAGKKWYYAALVDFRSQFSNGYLYPANAAPQFNSAAFSPAYLIISLGMEYKPSDSFSVFLSPLTARTTIVSNDSMSFYGKYGVPRGQHALYEVGAFVSANYIVAISSILSYTTRLDLFSNYLGNPFDLDVYFTNMVNAKLGKFLTASLSVNLIYDNNVLFTDANGVMGPRLQFQELIGVGFSYKF
jgi:hypothetical protein